MNLRSKVLATAFAATAFVSCGPKHTKEENAEIDTAQAKIATDANIFVAQMDSLIAANYADTVQTPHQKEALKTGFFVGKVREFNKNHPEITVDKVNFTDGFEGISFKKTIGGSSVELSSLQYNQ